MIRRTRHVGEWLAGFTSAALRAVGGYLPVLRPVSSSGSNTKRLAIQST
ncbi:hypothetical protein OXH74_08165 [Metapseudomonas boanensis]